jgi:recombination protein RecT
MASQQVMTREDDSGSLRQSLATRSAQFAAVLPAHITPEKFNRTIITAVQGDPELLAADRQSLFLACMKCAQDGLLPDKREAALVIFKENKNVGGELVWTKKVQYMPMVYGLRKKILQSNEVSDITAKVVYRRELDEGAFIYEEGSNAMLLHKPMYDLTDEETQDSEIIAAYSMATFKDGSKSYEVMRRFEITKVQNVSQTGALLDRKGKPRTPSGPWKDWYPEQCKKTVMRRHSKSLPQSGDIILDREDDGYNAGAATLLHLDQRDPSDPTRTALPTRDDEEQTDAQTGEVIKQGRSDEDEETARQLDAAQAAEQSGDDDANANNADADAPAYQDFVDDIMERVTKAKMLGDALSAGMEFDKQKEFLPDPVVAAFNKAMAETKKRFGK